MNVIKKILKVYTDSSLILRIVMFRRRRGYLCSARSLSAR